ncbi:MAG: prepilin-type N-terminal cleavage/methylation domain-containing protein [Nitrospirales bacterium]|nr:prepilin-type N-terminal cleavage/methylation domain-containing protein [Nitrospirales bacterium]
MRKGCIGSQRGFTLLELLLAVAILGIVVVLIAGAMRLGFRSVESGERKVESLERLRTSLSLLDAQIQSAFALAETGDSVEAGGPRYRFTGEHLLIEFPSNYSLWSGPLGHVMVTYRVVPDERGGQTLSVAENIIGTDATREAVLLDRAREVSFEYFFKEAAEEKGSWVEQWTDTESIPEKIRVKFVSDAVNLSLIIPVRGRGAAARTTVTAGEAGVPADEQTGGPAGGQAGE